MLFYIDTRAFILKKMDMVFYNQRLKGNAQINYANINGIMVPVSTAGKSALEIGPEFLVGMSFNLKSENLKINTGITADKLR